MRLTLGTVERTTWAASADVAARVTAVEETAAAASDTVASLRGPGPRGSSDMADEDTFPLDGDGLREVVWDECDAPFVGAVRRLAGGRGGARDRALGGRAAGRRWT